MKYSVYCNIFNSLIIPQKYQDPLHFIFDYVSGVSNEDSAMHLYVATFISQRSPDCDMVLVHDVDLAQISGICDSNVNKDYMTLVPSYSCLQSLETFQPDVVENHLQGSNVEIHRDLCRKRLLV